MLRPSKLILAALAVAAASMNSAVNAELTEYSGGHADIGLAYHDGEMEWHYHFGDNARLNGEISGMDVEREPNEAYVRVPDAAQVTAAAPYDFLGVNAGESFWELPSGSPGSLPFVGLATEELPDDVFTGLATLSLSNFQGPGQFALYQFSGPTPDVFWRTNDGVDSTVDTLELPIGAHDHFNWGFTEPGVYQLTLTGTADLVGGGSQTAMGTFSFAVGDVTAIPEPSAVAALLAVSAGGMAVTIRRRRARKAHEG